MKEKSKILVTDDVHTNLLEGLAILGKVDYQPTISYQSVQDIISSYHGLIINSKIRVDDNFLNIAENLKWVGRLGSGLDIVDLEAAKMHNVHVINSPEGNANAVGEHALGMLLSLLNHIPESDKMVRQLSPWNRESVRGMELDGKSVGIIGCGHTGSAFARKLNGFDIQLYIFDKYKKDIPSLHPNQIITSQEQILAQCDVVSLHLPLTDETNNMVDKNFLAAMKPTAILINTSRGSIVKLEQLCNVLENRQLGGACLDVFEEEKVSKYTSDDVFTMRRLSRFSNVVMTPHVAGWTVESKRKIADVLLKKIIYVASN